MRAALALCLLAACSVPDLSVEGKQCPCIAGFVCNTTTNTCVRPSDGGVDTPISTECLGGPPGALLYQYAGTFDWTSPDATWSGTTSQIVQTDSGNMAAFAFTPSVSQATYRVVASMQQTTGGGGMPRVGIALRATSTTDVSQYDCVLEPKNGMFLVTSTNAAGMSTTLASANGTGATSNTIVTMEAEIIDVASQPTISCCLREFPSAKLMNVVDAGNAHPTGQPGLYTSKMAASFNSFAVFAP